MSAFWRRFGQIGQIQLARSGQRTVVECQIGVPTAGVDAHRGDHPVGVAGRLEQLQRAGGVRDAQEVAQRVGAIGDEIAEAFELEAGLGRDVRERGFQPRRHDVAIGALASRVKAPLLVELQGRLKASGKTPTAELAISSPPWPSSLPRERTTLPPSSAT